MSSERFTGIWPEQWYLRRCPMCSWLVHKNEWDDTPPCTHCPTCGLELERLSCRECDAPMTARQLGFGETALNQFCAYCGAPNGPPREQQMRVKLAKSKPQQEET